MAESNIPLIGIVGNVKLDPAAPAAAEELGRELAKAGLRILVYSSGADFLEGCVVRGYVASRLAGRGSVQVRYPFKGDKPAFAEQQTNEEVFDWRPDYGQDWEISFYQSIDDVDGILLMGGGNSTLIAGVVAMGHEAAILALAGFGGNAAKVWEALRPGRDLLTPDEYSMMARPGWNDDRAAACVATLKAQIARKAERERLRRLEERRREISVTRHAAFALGLFLLSVLSVAWGWSLPHAELQANDALLILWLLFITPLLAGVSGATVRLVFDSRQGAVPLSSQSAITTAALGLIAGGVAGLLFITAQVTTADVTEGIVSAKQAAKLLPFGLLIGFIGGLTMDAVFRKLIAADVVDLSSIEAKK
jgi:hypothetical protein